MPKTQSERFQAHAERRKAAGLVRRTYWIPASQEAQIKALIEQLTNKGQSNER